MPRLCEFYPGICLKTEENAQKNLSQGKKTSVRVQYTYYQNTHSLQNIHTPTQTHTRAHTHIHTHSTTSHTHTHASARARARPHKHKHAHTQTRPHARARTHTHTHTHTRPQNTHAPTHMANNLKLYVYSVVLNVAQLRKGINDKCDYQCTLH